MLSDVSREVSATIVDEFDVTDDTLYELGWGNNTVFELTVLEEMLADGLPHTLEALTYTPNHFDRHTYY